MDQQILLKTLVSKMSGFFGQMNNVCQDYMKKHQIKGQKAPPQQQKQAQPGQKQTRVKKQVKDPLAPKKVRTAYIQFCQFLRLKYPEKFQNITFQEQASLQSREWKKLPQNKKNVFVQRQADDKTRYEKEIAEYNKKNGNPEKPAPKKRKAPQKQKQEVVEEVEGEDENAEGSVEAEEELEEEVVDEEEEVADEDADEVSVGDDEQDEVQEVDEDEEIEEKPNKKIKKQI